MCGRYYVDDETAREIEKIIRQVNNKYHPEMKTGDVYPTQCAPVICMQPPEIGVEMYRWGIPVNSGTIFNARSEQVLQKPMFREGIQRKRVIIPASSFYEWNSRKEKNVFRRMDHALLFMAGCLCATPKEDRFVILTTAANASMKPVHDRMPLILEPEEMKGWLMDTDYAAALLQKTPCLLERSSDYEQLQFPFS